MGKYLMSKKDFTIDGFSAHVLEHGNTHVEVNFEQMKFVNQNPKVNGPKLLHYLVVSAGVAADVRDAGFIALLQKEQAKIDKGEAPYVPPVSEPKAEEVAVESEPVADAAVANEAIESVRSHLMTIEDKAEIAKYAEATLGLNLTLKGNWGKERMIEAIVAALSKPKA